MNNKIVPIHSSQESKENYISHLEASKNFAQRITKNPFVKQFLIERDGKACSWCNKHLKDHAIIHHISYDHYCSYNVVIKTDGSTTKRPNRKRIIPECESCKRDTNGRFLNCVSKLVIVHGLCNKEIADVRHSQL